MLFLKHVDNIFCYERLFERWEYETDQSVGLEWLIRRPSWCIDAMVFLLFFIPPISFCFVIVCSCPYCIILLLWVVIIISYRLYRAFPILLLCFVIICLSRREFMRQGTGDGRLAQEWAFRLIIEAPLIAGKKLLTGCSNVAKADFLWVSRCGRWRRKYVRVASGVVSRRDVYAVLC